jgi:hypothetical protein
MGQRRKLRRFGSATYGVTLGVDMLNLMGTSVEEAKSEEGVEVDVTVFGQTLIIRLPDAPRLSPAELAYFMSQDIAYAKFFPTTPPDPNPKESEADPRLNINALFKPGKAVKLSKVMRTIVQTIAEQGPLTTTDLVDYTGLGSKIAARGLRSGFESGLFTKNGPVYSLSPDVFEV